MVFDVESLTSQELMATMTLIEKLDCQHINNACVDCPCFAICVFLRDVHNKCEGVMVERYRHDNH